MLMTCTHPNRPAGRWRTLGVVLLAAAWGAGTARATPPPTLGPEDLRPGDRAVVRTVFRGDSIEEFPAEILGVLSGGRLDGPVILARATSDRLERTGVAQGMSGSPVYVDGKLVGALATGWTFEREPLFGITPIREMLRVLEQPGSGVTGPSAGPAGVELAASPSVRFGAFHWDDGEPPAPPAGSDRGAAPEAGPVALPVPLAAGGMNPAALELARRRLAPLGFAVVPGGSLQGSGPDAASLQPGSAAAVDLLRGDLSLSAIGTVTWRDGDRVLLFGHPFFQSGDVRLPLSTARITTVVGSVYTSFKVGLSGREVGVVTQDRRSGLLGTIGPRARLLPLSVSVEQGRGAAQRFRFAMVEDRGLAPQLAGVAALNSLLESGGIGANQTLRWTMRLHRRGASALEVGDVISSDTPTGEFANGVSGPLGFLFNNPYARLDLDSVEVSVSVQPGRQEWTLRSARLLDAAVRPGGAARVECVVERWHGAQETRIVDMPVPEELPDGRYALWVGGGAELSRFEAARLPGRYRPTSLDDAWRRFARLRRSDALYATIVAGAPDVTSQGRDYPELPGSASVVLASGLEAGDAARRAATALVGEIRLPLDGETRGELQLPLTVDTKAP